MLLAAMIIKSLKCMPYNIHKKTPKESCNRVMILTSCMDLVLRALIICGINENMVKIAAVEPIIGQTILSAIKFIPH